MARCAVLILAGGSGSRLGSEIPKQYLNLNGLPVLRRTIDAFLAHPGIEAVQVVIGAQDRERYDNAIGDADIRRPYPAVHLGRNQAETGLKHWPTTRRTMC